MPQQRIYTTKPCPRTDCPNMCSKRANWCLSCSLADRRVVMAGKVAAAAAAKTPAAQVATDREESRKDRELRTLRECYRESLATIEQYELELRTVTQMQEGLETYTIEPSVGGGKGEATAVVLASDWHYEERVGAEVGGLNLFNRDIAHARIQQFFRKANSLTNMLSQDIEIPTMVLALLGDFITNDIHEEMAESNDLLPMHAVIEVQNHLVSGINHLLASSPRRLIIPCHSGNHARTTKTTRFGSENGHSLEFLMYHHLAAHFRDDPRVQFIIPQGPHSYLDVYGQVIRFRHGHDLKYLGGVGGLTIPVNKAIANDNRARVADLDVFGHYHQLVDGGRFICNGSLIGYNAYAMTRHFSFEQPKQALFLLDRKRGRTCLWPILLTEVA